MNSFTITVRISAPFGHSIALPFRPGGAAQVIGRVARDDTDPQFAIEYEIYVNGVLSPLPVAAGVDRDFVYTTAQGENTFTVKAVDRAGNTSEASNALTAVLWPC